MPANAVDYAADETKAAASEAAARLTTEAQRTFADAKKRIEAAVAEGVEQLRAQSRAYADTAGQQIDEASKYLTEQVKERPLAATGAALGIGVLIGLLLSARR
ncbi:MAG: hypothetical protein ABW360_02695 [Phenylobacterium sp.]